MLQKGQSLSTTINAGESIVFVIPSEVNQITLSFYSGNTNLEAFIQIKTYDK